MNETFSESSQIHLSILKLFRIFSLDFITFSCMSTARRHIVDIKFTK